VGNKGEEIVTTTAPLLEDTKLEPKAGGFYRHQNFLTGLITGIISAVVFWAIAHATIQGSNWGSDMVVTVTLVAWVVGFNIGIGSFNAVLRWTLGHDQDHEDELYAAGVGQGWKRYFKFCTDHKVVGTQYLVLVMVLFAVGGTLAMMIRTQLLTPHSRFLSPETYNAIVSIHGMVMIIATIIMVSGPFANFIMPIMIGAKDMAFPRLNALSFWLVVSAVPPILASFLLGGVDSGWTTYAPLSAQSPMGQDGFAITICTFVCSVTVAGINTIVTTLTMRTTGMTMGRLPIFVWGSVIAGALGLYAMPAFLMAQSALITDRVVGTSFYVSMQGGTGWLYENTFWIMGHPEVYVILIPPVAALAEIGSTFARKPVFGYKILIAGMAGIATLAIMVWAHHMFTTGWAPNLADPFMLTTELISIPTGIIFLCLIGTIWRGNIWTRLPMYFLYLFLFNFIIGGITGIYLSDVPVDQYFHGNMFVTAHFHYTLLGGAMIGAAGAVAYWFPKVTTRMLNERIGKTAFWMIAIGIQVTYFGQFWEGFQGMPRRVANYNALFLHANQMSTAGAYLLMAGWIVFLYAIVHSWRNGEKASANPWHAKTLEWHTLTPVPLENFLVDPVITTGPYTYGEPDPIPAPQPEPAVVGSTSSQEGAH